MSYIFRTIVDAITAGERTVNSPIFIKEFDKENKQLNDLLDLSEKLQEGNKKKQIESDIANIRRGIQGESAVHYEIKNSMLPILCLHDIRLKNDDYVAQMDFIIISNKFICVLETKQLWGNIVVNSSGDFIRILTDKNGREIKKEGMYSPIAQNDRHIRILKDALAKEGWGKTMPFYSLVVLANSKTIVNKAKCPKTIRNSIIKHDQLASVLRDYQNDKDNEKNMLEKYMFDFAHYILENDTPIEYDYRSKYSLVDDDFLPTNNGIRETTLNEHDRQQLYNELKKYRLSVSKRDYIAAYMVFNNEELDALISRYPTNESEILEVKGFGKKRVEKYGQDILMILSGFNN